MSQFHSITMSRFHSTLGPFGERDEEQVFIQRVIPETSSIFIRHSSTGHRWVWLWAGLMLYYKFTVIGWLEINGRWIVHVADT